MTRDQWEKSLRLASELVTDRRTGSVHGSSFAYNSKQGQLDNVVLPWTLPTSPARLICVAPGAFVKVELLFFGDSSAISHSATVSCILRLDHGARYHVD